MSKTKTAKKATNRKSTKTSKAAPAKKTPAAKATAAKAGTANGKAKDKKLSAIDAAAKVLESAKSPMTTKEMIDAMAAKKLWSSPGGKTPHATLYSAILREIGTKGKEARFKKTERGKFAANG
jgi:hypothetical protein